MYLCVCLCLCVCVNITDLHMYIFERRHAYAQVPSHDLWLFHTTKAPTDKLPEKPRRACGIGWIMCIHVYRRAHVRICMSIDR